MAATSLNAVYSRRRMRRRYEVWFLRLSLNDGSGAWWLRYLLLNLGRSCFGGCGGNALGFPAQIWATWFPRSNPPQSFIAGFSQGDLAMSERFASPFFLEFSGNRINENSCRADFEVEGHRLSWDLRYRSTVGYTMSDKKWIGFSRTPHCDAVFSGRISFDDRAWEADPLGFGLQGHNCGYHHRRLWTWTHCIFAVQRERATSTFEALEYEMPFGLRFQKAFLWTGGELLQFSHFAKTLRQRENLRWSFHCSNPGDQTRLEALVDGSGTSLHRLPYLKTDCSSTFEVSNNSLARAKIHFVCPERPGLDFSTDGGAAIEMAGE